MKQVVMKQWVKALRSGKYRKGRGALKRKGHYCCLGVLCDISGLGEWERSDYGTRDGVYLNEQDELPEKVRKWAGMKTGCGELPDSEALTVLNDGTGNSKPLSFAAIADLIEANWRRL